MRWFNVLAAMAFVAVLASSEVLDCAEGRWQGRWVDVAATAYTPTDALDSAYHATKGARWRWVLADGRTHAKRTPYGIAVKLTQGRDEKWRPALPFGTRIYVPQGYGYLDRSRAGERVFTVDDGSASSQFDGRIGGRMHIDMRWVDGEDAVAWSGALGHQAMRVFIIERELARPEPVRTWPLALVEAELPPIAMEVVQVAEPPPARTWPWGLLALTPFLVAALGALIGLREPARA